MDTRAQRIAADNFAGCRICSGCGIGLFGELSGAELKRAGTLQVAEITARPGDVLYRQGDACEAVFVVRSGLLKLEQFTPGGRRRIVRLAHAESALGLEGLVQPQAEHEAVVLKDAELCRIPVDAMARLMDESPNFRQRIMALWHENVVEADVWLTQLSTGCARIRMARFLLMLAGGRPGGFEILSREDIGAALGITTETASRTIAEFRRSGLLTGLGARMFAANVEGLRALAWKAEDD